MLKNIFLTIVLINLIQPSFAQPIEEKNKKENFFYVGPIDLFLNTLQLGYEKKLMNNNTIAMLGGFKLSEKEGERNRIGGNGELQYRINLLYNKEAISKIVKNYSTFAYFAPFLQYKYEEITDKIYLSEAQPINSITTINSYFGGLGFGSRFSGVENRFCLNVFAGGGIKYSSLTGDKKYSNFLQVGYTGIAPKIEFHMGIAF